MVRLKTYTETRSLTDVFSKRNWTWRSEVGKHAVSRANIAGVWPTDLKDKVEKSIAMRGSTFVQTTRKSYVELANKWKVHEEARRFELLHAKTRHSDTRP